MSKRMETSCFTSETGTCCGRQTLLAKEILTHTLICKATGMLSAIQTVTCSGHQILTEECASSCRATATWSCTMTTTRWDGRPIRVARRQALHRALHRAQHRALTRRRYQMCQTSPCGSASGAATRTSTTLPRSSGMPSRKPISINTEPPTCGSCTPRTNSSARNNGGPGIAHSFPTTRAAGTTPCLSWSSSSKTKRFLDSSLAMR